MLGKNATGFAENFFLFFDGSLENEMQQKICKSHR
jgi:hypothetical protein